MLLMMLLMRIILRMIIQTSIIPAMTLSIMTTHTRTLRLWILQRRITQTLTPTPMSMARKTILTRITSDTDNSFNDYSDKYTSENDYNYTDYSVRENQQVNQQFNKDTDVNTQIFLKSNYFNCIMGI